MKMVKDWLNSFEHGEYGMWDSISGRRATLDLQEKHKKDIYYYIKLMDLAEKIHSYNPESIWCSTKDDPYDEFEKLPETPGDERRVVFQQVYSLYCREVYRMVKTRNRLNNELETI